MNKNTFSKKDISIIGAGRAGTTLAAVISRLDLQDIRITAILSRSRESLDRAKRIIGKASRAIMFSSSMEDLPGTSNCIMICTPDDKIKSVCRSIVERRGGRLDGILFIHFSGAKQLNVLEPAMSRGASAVSVHPLKSFASIEDSIRTIKGTVYGVTYSPDCGDDARSFISFLIKKLEGRIIMVADETKSIYHASACVASNYLVSLINYAVKLNEASRIVSSRVR